LWNGLGPNLASPMGTSLVNFGKGLSSQINPLLGFFKYPFDLGPF